MPKLERKERAGLPYYEFEKDKSAERAKANETEQRKDEVKSDFEAAKRVAGEGGLTGRKWGRG